MNQFKKLGKAFTTWRSSWKSSSEYKQNSDDAIDASRYWGSSLMSRLRDFEEATNMLTNRAAQASASGQQLAWNAVSQAGVSMSVVNQSWHPAMSIDSSGNVGLGTAIGSGVYAAMTTMANFTVEKVDNGYILRSAKRQGEITKVKICKDMDELRDLFVATMVEYQLEK